MATIVTRAGKGSPLTNAEVDANFVNLNNDKLEVATAASTYAPLTGTGASGTWNISITGNAATATNGVVTTGSYANPTWITSLAETKVLPSQTGNSGKFLTTNGSSTSWGTVDLSPYLEITTAASTYVALAGSYANPSWITSLAETKVLPTQTSNSGKYLTTNGTSTSWADVVALPSQTGQSGKYLTTNGTVASWAAIDLTAYAALAGTQTFSGVNTFSNTVILNNEVNIQAKDTGGTARGLLRLSNGNNVLLLNAGNGQVLVRNQADSTTLVAIDASGNLTATGDITSNSDERLKENIEVIPNALARVESVRGVTFTRKADGSHGMGVVAQEIRKVAPEVVMIGTDGMMSVSYGNLVGLLIEAVKDLSGQVKELKQKVGV